MSTPSTKHPNFPATTTTTTTNPHPTPASRKHPAPSPMKRLLDRIHLAYYRYEVTFGVYTMTPGEKLVAHAFVLVVLALLVWAVCLYFPSVVFQKLGRLAWLLTGRGSSTGAVSTVGEGVGVGAATSVGEHGAGSSGWVGAGAKAAARAAESVSAGASRGAGHGHGHGHGNPVVDGFGRKGEL